MTVHEERMLENLELTHGALYSQRALTALVESGMGRDEAYRLVQQAAQRAWDERTPFRELLEEAVDAYRTAPGREAEDAGRIDINAVLDPNAYLEHSDELIGRLEDLR
jgi:adenylosuccinate lyase